VEYSPRFLRAADLDVEEPLRLPAAAGLKPTCSPAGLRAATLGLRRVTGQVNLLWMRHRRSSPEPRASGGTIGEPGTAPWPSSNSGIRGWRAHGVNRACACPAEADSVARALDELSVSTSARGKVCSIRSVLARSAAAPAHGLITDFRRDASVHCDVTAIFRQIPDEVADKPGVSVTAWRHLEHLQMDCAASKKTPLAQGFSLDDRPGLSRGAHQSCRIKVIGHWPPPKLRGAARRFARSVTSRPAHKGRWPHPCPLGTARLSAMLWCPIFAATRGRNELGWIINSNDLENHSESSA
jgi:hypothetical protein